MNKCTTFEEETKLAKCKIGVQIAKVNLWPRQKLVNFADFAIYFVRLD